MLNKVLKGLVLVKNLEEDWEEEDVGEKGDEEEWEEEEWWPLKSPIFNHYLILVLIFYPHTLTSLLLLTYRAHAHAQPNRPTEKQKQPKIVYFFDICA